MKANDVKLTEIVDLEFLQQFQDLFAQIMGVASITVDDEGPITKPSNFTDFCIKYTRNSKEGNKKCNECDINWGKIAAEKKKPVIYKCHTGLTDFAVPIVINDEHVASILAGQVLTEQPDLEHFRKVAHNLEINEDDYINALKKINIVSEEHVKKAADLLFLVGNAISKIGHRNYELIKKRKKEELINNITEKIRSSLNIEQTLLFICEETAKLFNVQRVAITSFPEEGNYEKYIISKEYKTNEEITGFGNYEDANKVAYYWGKNLLEKKEVIAFSELDNPEAPDFFSNFYKSIGVKSIMGTGIIRGDNVWGTLILSAYEKKEDWSNEDKTVLKTIANQIYIAINQAELYEKEKNRAEREKLLRKVIETVRSSLDINSVKEKVISEVCQSFNADRCYFRSFNKKEDKFLPVDIEYLSSEEIKSIKGIEPDQEGLRLFSDTIRNDSKGFVPVIMTHDSIPYPEAKAYIDTFDIKADYAVPIINRNDEVSWLVLHYTKDDPKLGEEDKKLLETIAYQIDIAFEQIRLFNEAKITAEREKINRNIIEILRSSINKDIIKQQFVRNIGKFFKADRVLFFDYDEKGKRYLPVEKGCEYLSSPEQKSFVGYDWSNPNAREYIEPLLEKRELRIDCWKDYISTNQKGKDFIELFEDAKVQSSYNFPVMYQGTTIGYFCVEFTGEECVKLCDEDINRIRSMCSQAGIALYHANLYEQSQNLAATKMKYMITMSQNCLLPLEKINTLTDPLQNTIDNENIYPKTSEIHEISKKLLNKIKEINEELKQDFQKTKNKDL